MIIIHIYIYIYCYTYWSDRKYATLIRHFYAAEEKHNTFICACHIRDITNLLKTKEGKASTLSSANKSEPQAEGKEPALIYEICFVMYSLCIRARHSSNSASVDHRRGHVSKAIASVGCKVQRCRKAMYIIWNGITSRGLWLIPSRLLKFQNDAKALQIQPFLLKKM